MNIFIRTDASVQIGTGHIMRCLALADALRDHGATIYFICRKLKGNLNKIISERGYFTRVLKRPDPKNILIQCGDAPAYAQWLETAWQQDMDESKDALQTGVSVADWLIVDHYAIDHRWESGMRQVAKKIMVIDDLADRAHDCDLLLDQNYFQEPGKRYKGLISEKCQVLLGPKYALLRPEFRQARQFSRMRGNGIGRILIYFGGNDSANLTGMALEALDCPELSHLLVELVAGPNNQYLDLLKKQAQNRPGTRLHIQPKSFTELMLRSDLFIGAGGTTTWERLCLGLPSIVIAVAKNQEAFTSELDKAGYLIWLGKKEDVTVSDIRYALINTISEPSKNTSALEKPSPVDGFGSLRIAELLMPSPKEALNLRKAEMDDMELFFFWANDPRTRKNSFQQEPITWSEHVEWFTRKLLSSDTIIMIMENSGGLPVGQIRFDMKNNTATINYSVDSLFRSRGWGKILVFSGINWLKNRFRDIRIQAIVKKNNVASCNIFESLNFSSATKNGISTYYSDLSDVNP